MKPVQEMVEMLSSDDEGDRLEAVVNLQQNGDEDTTFLDSRLKTLPLQFNLLLLQHFK